ncbi:MAG: Fibronectin type domain protein [Solirubrobacterales bacterium]|nr:Fibronectin type domain protein [Solirubrobacterales bacterium]
MERPQISDRWRRVGALAAALVTGLLLGAPSAGAVVSTVKPLKIRTETVKPATATVPYAQSLTAVGGTAPYTFTVESGSLPEGISLSPSGELSGTPNAAGASTFSVLATDSSSPAQSATKTYTLTVQLDVGPKSLRKANAWSYSQTLLSATGGTGPYNFSVVSGALPEGVELFSEPGNDKLSGSPYRAGTYTFTIAAADTASAATGTRTYKLHVGLGMSPHEGREVPTATVGQSYGEAICASGASASSTYVLSEGTLPEGLTLAPPVPEVENCAKITGTPEQAGKFNFTITATDDVSGMSRSVKLYVLVWSVGFPGGAVTLEETPREGLPPEAENISLTTKHEANGIISGTMFGGNFSSGKWSYNTVTHAVRFKWPETTGPEGEPGANLLYTGTCEPVAEKCTGENSRGSFTLKRF